MIPQRRRRAVDRDLIRLLRRDIGDLLFHFTKQPSTSRKRRSSIYRLTSVPKRISVEDFSECLRHRFFARAPEQLSSFKRAYQRSRNGKWMLLKRRLGPNAASLNWICQAIGYTSALVNVLEPTTPDAVLKKILLEGYLRGGIGGIEGGYRCVCFSETPIAELARLFALAARSRNTELLPRYAQYGIAIRKEWLFKKGGRPVIYQPPSEYPALPEALRYRHKSYDPTAGIDLTWEREWRLHSDKLRLDPSNTLVVVPTVDDAYTLALETATAEEGGAGPIFTWNIVALELLDV